MSEYFDCFENGWATSRLVLVKNINYLKINLVKVLNCTRSGFR